MKGKSTSIIKLWFERLMAIIAIINLTLVLFDISYIEWRDFYLKQIPQITNLYDPIKGIQPHRETQKYLKTLDELQQQVSITGLKSKAATAKLEELRLLSKEMIENNPFAGVGKSGTLEKIKNDMRDQLDKESAKEAFAIFWSQEYLLEKGWNEERKFFNSKIRPLIASNYYRQIGESGEFVDKFWKNIDLPFIILFGVELLVRSFYLKRRHPSFSLFNVIVWHWYDLWLIIPFWRWTRIIPVAFRLEKADLWNFRQLRRQGQQVIIANFAEEITEMVVVRVINQIQISIHRGELTKWLLQSENLRPYIDINNVNEVEAIAGILVQTTIYQVLPKVQPEIIAILQHTINSALNQTPIYRNFNNLPGVGQMQAQLGEQLSTQIISNLYKILVSSIEDPVGAKLSSQLIQQFTEAFGAEMQKKHVMAEVQSLLVDFLEEVKLNYVQRLSEEDIEQILEQTRKLQTNPSIQPIVERGSALLDARSRGDR
ncbi:MAG: hypothetical protein QNJ47_19180 [Nostocaceae cyanobacterium]|nr:hypothetical protein [Nostocaceae cyanobacterium]